LYWLNRKGSELTKLWAIAEDIRVVNHESGERVIEKLGELEERDGKLTIENKRNGSPEN